MKRAVVLGFVGVVLAAVAGCGGPDSATRELLVSLAQYSEAIEKKEPPDRQRAAFDRARGALEKFQKLTAGEQDGMRKKYDKDFQRAQTRFEAAKRQYVLEGGTEPLDVLDGFK